METRHGAEADRGKDEIRGVIMKRIAIAVSVVVLVFAVAAWTQTSTVQSGPEYKILDAWAGDWTIQAEAKDSSSGLASNVDCILKGQRILGGFFLEVHHTYKSQGGVQTGLEVTGYDPTKKTCMTHVFFDDGSWIISTLTFIDERTCIEDGTTYSPDGKVEKCRITWNFSPDWMSLSVKKEDEKDGTWWTSMEGKGVRSQEK